MKADRLVNARVKGHANKDSAIAGQYTRWYVLHRNGIPTVAIYDGDKMGLDSVEWRWRYEHDIVFRAEVESRILSEHGMLAAVFPTSTRFSPKRWKGYPVYRESLMNRPENEQLQKWFSPIEVSEYYYLNMLTRFEWKPAVAKDAGNHFVVVCGYYPDDVGYIDKNGKTLSYMRVPKAHFNNGLNLCDEDPKRVAKLLLDWAEKYHRPVTQRALYMLNTILGVKMEPEEQKSTMTQADYMAKKKPGMKDIFMRYIMERDKEHPEICAYTTQEIVVKVSQDPDLPHPLSPNASGQVSFYRMQERKKGVVVPAARNPKGSLQSADHRAFDSSPKGLNGLNLVPVEAVDPDAAAYAKSLEEKE